MAHFRRALLVTLIVSMSLLGGCTEEAFIASSHVAMRELESKACEENFATGGHGPFWR